MTRYPTNLPGGDFQVHTGTRSRIRTHTQRYACIHTHDTKTTALGNGDKISPRFLTRPQLSPSGVSAGQSIPHWLGCSARGPDTFRSFWNWLSTLVIMPRDEMKLSRERTCVTPCRSTLNRFSTQFPVEMACVNPFVMVVEPSRNFPGGLVQFLFKQMRIANCKLQTANRKPQTTSRKLQAANCKLPAANFWRLKTVTCSCEKIL